MLEKQKEDLIKGFYSLFTNYGKESNGIAAPVKKKGSDIKNSLSDLSIKINTEKQGYLDKINEVIGKLPYQPIKKPTMYSEYHHLISYIPNKFMYSDLYDGREYVDNSSGIDKVGLQKPTEEELKVMRSYNDYVCKYIELCVSKIKVDVLRKNIQDNKSYDLTVDQLAILGL